MDAPINVLRIEHNTISKELGRFRACHSESRCFYCREWAQFIYKKRYAWNTKLPEEPQTHSCQLMAAGRYNIAVQHPTQQSLAKTKTRSSTMFEKLRHLLDVATTETTPNGMSTSLTKELVSICNTWLTMPSSLSSLPEIFEPISIQNLPDNFDEDFDYDDDEDDRSLNSENSMLPEHLLSHLVIERQGIVIPSQSLHVLLDLTADFLPIQQNIPCAHYRPDYSSPGDLEVEVEIYNHKMAQATSNALVELEQALDVAWHHLTEFMDRLLVLENERCELMGPQCQATMEAFAASQNLLSFQDYWATQNFSKRRGTVEQVDAAFAKYWDDLKECVNAFHTEFVIPRLEAVRQLVRQLWSMIVPTIQQMAERMASHELSNETHLQKCRAVAESLRELHPTVDVAYAVETVQQEMTGRMNDYMEEIDALKKAYTEESRPATSSRLDKINNKEFKKRVKKVENVYYSTRQHFRYQITQKIFPESLFCKFSLVCIEALMQEGEMMEAVTIEREVKRFLESHDELVDQHDNLLYAFESSAQVGRRKFVGILGNMFLQESIRIKGEIVALNRQNKLLKSMDLPVGEPETSKKKKKNKKKEGGAGSPLPTPSISTVAEKLKSAQKEPQKATKAASSPKVTEKSASNANTAAPKSIASPKVAIKSSSTIPKSTTSSTLANLSKATDKEAPTTSKTSAATGATASTGNSGSANTLIKPVTSSSNTKAAQPEKPLEKAVNKPKISLEQEAKNAKEAKEAKEAQEAKQAQEAREAQEAKAKEAESRAKIKAEVKAAREAKMESLRQARAKVEAEARAKAEAELKAKEQAEEEARAKAKAKAQAAREAREKAEAERKAKEQAEQEAKAAADKTYREARDAKNKAKAEAEAAAKAKAEAESKVSKEEEQLAFKAREAAEAEARDAAAREASAAKLRAIAAKEEAEAQARIAIIREAAETKAKATAKVAAQQKSKLRAFKETSESKQKPIVNKTKSKEAAEAARIRYEKAQEIEEAREREEARIREEAKILEDIEAAAKENEKANAKAEEEEDAAMKKQAAWATQILAEEAKAAEAREFAAVTTKVSVVIAAASEPETAKPTVSDEWKSMDLGGWGIEVKDELENDGWEQVPVTKKLPEAPKPTSTWSQKVSTKPAVLEDTWTQKESSSVADSWNPKPVSPAVDEWNAKTASPVVDSWNSKASSPAVDSWNSKAASPAVDEWNAKTASPVVDSWNAKPVASVVDEWNAKPASPVVEAQNTKPSSPVDEWNTKSTSPAVDEWNTKSTSPAVDEWNTKSTSPAVDEWNTKSAQSVTDSWNSKPESPVVDAWKPKTPRTLDNSWTPKAAGSSNGGKDSDNWRKPLSKESTQPSPSFPNRPESKNGQAKPAWNKRDTKGWNQGWEENKDAAEFGKNLGGWGKDSLKEKSIEMPWEDKSTPSATPTSTTTFTTDPLVNNGSRFSYSPLAETISTKTTTVAEIVSAPEPEVVHFSLKGLSTPQPPGLTKDIPIQQQQQQQEQQQLQSSFVGQRNDAILPTDNLWSMGHEGLISVIQTLQRDNAQLVQTLVTTQQEMAMMTGRYSELLALSREREAQTLQLFEARKQTEMEEARRYIHSLEAKIGLLETQLQTATMVTGGSTAGFGNQDLFAGYREEMRSNRTKRPWNKNVVVRCGNCGGAGHASAECNDVCRYCGSGEHLSESCTSNNDKESEGRQHVLSTVTNPLARERLRTLVVKDMTSITRTHSVGRVCLT